MRERAREDYNVQLIVWGSRSPWMKQGKPPKIPEILAKED